MLFFVSGMGVYFAFRRRTAKQLLAERARRIFVPLLFGSIFIVPLWIYFFQLYYNLDFFYAPSPGHLWFLGNLMLYIVLLLPLLNYMKKHPDFVIWKSLREAFRKYPVMIYIFALPYVLEAFLISAESSYSIYGFNLHGLWIGLISFVLGFTIFFIGDSFWKATDTLKWWCVIIAFGMYMYRVYFADMNVPHWQTAIESIHWIFAVFGFAYRYLNRPIKRLPYLNKSVLPIYIIHMPIMYMGALIILPLELNAFIKYMFIVSFTVVGCFILYEFVIRRIRFLHLFFGMKG